MACNKPADQLVQLANEGELLNWEDLARRMIQHVDGDTCKEVLEDIISEWVDVGVKVELD